MQNPVAEVLRELDQVVAAHEFTRWLDRQLDNFHELDQLAAAIAGGFLLLQPEEPPIVERIAVDLGVGPEVLLHALSEVTVCDRDEHPRSARPEIHPRR